MWYPLAAGPQKVKPVTKTCWRKGRQPGGNVRVGYPCPRRFHYQHRVLYGYYANGCKLPAELTDQVLAGMKKIEAIMEMKYGDAVNPLLVSCRSGARSSMPE